MSNYEKSFTLALLLMWAGVAFAFGYEKGRHNAFCQRDWLAAKTASDSLAVMLNGCNPRETP